MKKYVSLLLIIIMALSLVACENASNSTKEKKQTQTYKYEKSSTVFINGTGDYDVYDNGDVEKMYTEYSEILNSKAIENKMKQQYPDIKYKVELIQDEYAKTIYDESSFYTPLFSDCLLGARH